MGVTAWVVYYGLHLVLPVRILCLGVAMVCAMIVYLVLYVLITKTTEEQMRKFPMGNYIVKALRMIRVFR